MAPFTILLISHWSRVISEILLHFHNSQPLVFQNGMTLENRVKIDGAMSKNIAVKLQRP